MQKVHEGFYGKLMSGQSTDISRFEMNQVFEALAALNEIESIHLRSRDAAKISAPFFTEELDKFKGKLHTVYTLDNSCLKI